jgi:hypothetical protein
MASQNCGPKDVPYSRQVTQCDYCGLKLNRHNIKNHTKQAHPKQPVRERQIRQRPFDSMFAAAKKPRVEANLNDAFGVVDSEKDLTEKDEIESQYLAPNDLDFSPSAQAVNKIYQHITKNHDLMDKLEEIDSKVTGHFATLLAGWLAGCLAGWLVCWLYQPA